MKRILQIFFVISLLTSTNYAQKIEKVTPEEYVNYLQKIKNEYVIKDKMNEIDLKEAKKMIYLAYHTNPIPIKQMLWNEWKEREKKYHKGDREFNDKLFRDRKYGSQEDIRGLLQSDLIDTLEYNLIWNTALMIRGKVIDKEIVNIPPSNPTSRLPGLNLVYLTIQIDDILIGNNTITNKKNNKIIKVLYNQRIVTVNYAWKKSETYLFNLSYDVRPDSLQIPRILEYGDFGIFSIKDEILFDKENVFKIGREVEWSDFKEMVNNKVNNIVFGKIGE